MAELRLENWLVLPVNESIANGGISSIVICVAELHKEAEWKIASCTTVTQYMPGWQLQA